MKHISVIAIKHGNQYISSVCYSSDPQRVFALLEESFSAPNAALNIVSQGDSSLTSEGCIMAFYHDLQYNWTQCCPVLMASTEGLIEHAKSIGASSLYLYDHNAWMEHWHYELEESLSIA